MGFSTPRKLKWFRTVSERVTLSICPFHRSLVCPPVRPSASLFVCSFIHTLRQVVHSSLRLLICDFLHLVSVTYNLNNDFSSVWVAEQARSVAQRAFNQSVLTRFPWTLNLAVIGWLVLCIVYTGNSFDSFNHYITFYSVEMYLNSPPAKPSLG